MLDRYLEEEVVLNFIKEIKIINIAERQNRSRFGSCNHSEMCDLQRNGVGHN